jgi:hypothetical protein
MGLGNLRSTVNSLLTKVMDFHPIDFVNSVSGREKSEKRNAANVGVKMARKKLILGKYEVGEKFEMLWCGKEKAIGEYIWRA